MLPRSTMPEAFVPPGRVTRIAFIGAERYRRVEAARETGAQPAAILRRHILPAIVPVATTQCVLTAQTAIVVEATSPSSVWAIRAR